MKYGSIIRHKNAMDVAFRVQKTQGPFGSSQKYKLKGEWINMGFVQSYAIGIVNKIELNREALSQWELCLESEPQCIRHSQWKAL
jgi:hypothetical protein